MPKREFLVSYQRGILTSLRNNSAAYGYSIVVTSNFAALNYLVEAPKLFEIYLFIAGAVAGFAVLEAITTRMFRRKMRGESSSVVALGASFSIMSISVAMSVTALVGWLADSWWAWPVSAFGSTVAYLLLVGVELALAEQAEKEHEKSD